MAVRGHLRQREAGKPQAQAFWEPEEGEPLLCNPFSTTPRLEPGRCPFWQLLPSGLWEVEGGEWGLGGGCQCLNSPPQAFKRGASWCRQPGLSECVWEGGYKPPEAPRFPSGCSPPWLGGAPGPLIPTAKHKRWLHKKYSPRWSYPMGLRPDLQG